MRGVNRRKIQIQPIKSPSPDIANRNVITDTKAPIDDIERYNKSKSYSKSPRMTNSIIYPQGATEIEKMRIQISCLRQQIIVLQGHERQNKNLLRQNYKLGEQIKQLKDQLSKYKYPSGDNIWKTSQQGQKKPFSQNQSILKQFNQRLTRLSEQNKRISKKLQQQISKTEFLTKQNQMLKNEINFYKKQPTQISMIKSTAQQPNDQLYKFYQQSVDIHIRNHSDYIQKKVRQLQLKIQKVKLIQNVLQQRISKKKYPKDSTSSKTPQKDQVDNTVVSQWKSKYGTDSYPNQKDSILSQSPIKNIRDNQQRLKIENQKLLIKIDSLSSQLRRNKQLSNQRQNDLLNLQRKIHQMKRQKQISLLKNQQTKKTLISNQQLNPKPSGVFTQQGSVSTQVKFYQDKINDLQHQLMNKFTYVSSLQDQLENKQRQFIQLKKKLQEVNYLLERQMPNYQKIIQQQRQKNSLYQQEIRQIKQKYIPIIVDNQQLERVRHQNVDLNDRIKYFQREMNNRDNFIADTMKNYLLLTNSIKRTLSSQRIQTIYQSTQKLESNQINIQEMKIQNNTIIAQLRKALLLKEQYIIQLEKDNRILSLDVQQYKIQVERLKELIQNYQAPQLNYSIEKKIQMHNNTQITCNLKECLGEAITSINQLETKIKNILQE